MVAYKDRPCAVSKRNLAQVGRQLVPFYILLTIDSAEVPNLDR